MKKMFFYLNITFLTISCAGFKNADTKSVSLNTNSVSDIEGTYNNVPSSRSGFYVRSLSDVFDRNTNMFVSKEKYNKDLKVKVKNVNQNIFNVKIYESENVLFDKDVKVKLKKDGFFYLKEKRFMLDGIPLIFGGWNFQKSRFTVDQNNNLLVQSNYFFCNGVLVFMSDWKTFHYSLTFEKTQ